MYPSVLKLAIGSGMPGSNAIAPILERCKRLGITGCAGALIYAVANLYLRSATAQSGGRGTLWLLKWVRIQCLVLSGGKNANMASSSKLGSLWTLVSASPMRLKARLF